MHGVQLSVCFFESNGVFLTCLRGLPCYDLGSISFLFHRFDLGFKDGFDLVEFVNGLLGLFQPSSQTSIDGSNGLVSHDGKGFGDVGSVGFERQLRSLFLEGFKTRFKPKQVVQHRFERGLPGLGSCSHRGQCFHETGERKRFNRARISRNDGPSREPKEFHLPF